MLGGRINVLALTNRWIPTRAIICVMMFTACWTSYNCRLQMPILAVPMIIADPSDQPSSGACVPGEASGGGGGGGSAPAGLWKNPDNLLHDIMRDEFRQTSKAQSPDGPLQDILPDELHMPGRFKRQDDAAAPSKNDKRKATEMFTGKPFDWSPEIRGQLLAAYAYGNVPGNLMGGVLSMKFGPRRTIFWTSLISALISLVSPLIANIHWGALLASRVLVGLTGGVIFPACHTMVAKWAPPAEKSRFVWSLLGGTFGTILTYPMVAGIAEGINWECGWYIPSILMLVWVYFWFLLAYDSPAEHPGISEEEKNYIISSQAGTVRAEKPSLRDTPIKAIFTSVPFISLVLCHFGNMFLLFFYQNSMMLYLTKALGFKLTKGGFLASLPWLARLVFGFFFSWAGDTVKKKEIVTLTTFRKSATVFSHFLPGVCLIIVGYIGCNFTLANVFLFFALGFNGAASIANLTNNQDLSPNYAGFLYGIMNTFGTTSGMIIPPMVEEIAGKYGNPIDKWQIVFWIGAAVCISSMVVFIIGGSAKIQPWNEPRQRDAKANA